MADNEWESYEFNPVDVSKPVTPRKESEIIAEERSEYRRDWIHSHTTYIFAAVGIAAVALIFLIIHLYNQNTNPMSVMLNSSAKNLGVPFKFDVALSEDDEAVMSCSGKADIDNRTHSIRIAYDADYVDYSYKGVVLADGVYAVKGYYYEDEWTVRDCSERVDYYFDFDTDYRKGEFDPGSFLRFTGLTSRYYAKELDELVDILTDRLSTDSDIAVITTSKSEKGTLYSYDIDLYELLGLVVNDGASLFRSADVYNKFMKAYETSKDNIAGTGCTMSFNVDAHGYMTDFNINVDMDEHSYSLQINMSDFNMTAAEIPADFLQAATDVPTE